MVLCAKSIRVAIQYRRQVLLSIDAKFFFDACAFCPLTPFR